MPSVPQKRGEGVTGLHSGSVQQFVTADGVPPSSETRVSGPRPLPKVDHAVTGSRRRPRIGAVGVAQRLRWAPSQISLSSASLPPPNRQRTGCRETRKGASV